MIAAAVSGAVRAIAGACPVDADLLAERATALLAMIDDAARATLHAHPDDIALLQPLALPVALVADPAARRGDLCLRGAATMIEDGVTTALDRFEDALLS